MKVIKKDLEISTTQPRLVLEDILKSYDMEETLFEFRVINTNVTLSDYTVSYAIKIFVDGVAKVIEREVEYNNENVIRFHLPNEIAGYSGRVYIGLYAVHNEDKIDIKEIVLNMEYSIIDEEVDRNIDTYYETLDKVVQKLSTYEEDSERQIDEKKQFVNSTANEALQKIDESYQNIERFSKNTIASIIDSVVSDVESVADTVKADINAVLPTVNSYADTQKQAIDNIVDDVQSVGDTAKEDINAVLPTIQSQVNEIKTEIENIPDIPEVYTELADIKSYIGYTDTDVYGVEIDMVNRRFTRLAGAIGKNGGVDFDTINAYKRRRCILANDGTVLAYYGDSNYTESGLTTVEIVKNNVTYPVGTPVQVMVEQPKFYYKVVPLTVEPIANGKGYHMRKGRYYISDYPKEGFKVHPAFVRNGVVKEKIYLSAYEGSIYDTSASAYLLNDEQVADFSTDLLSSIANAKPCSGLTQNLTRSNARLLAHNRGNGWEQQTIQTVSLTQLLFLIEYAKFNMQDVLGMGATQKRDDGSTNMAEKTGSTTGLGNASGAVTNSNGTQIVSYRGEENPFGNIWKFVDGINVMANGIHAAYVADHDFAEKQSAGSYTDVGFTLAKTSGSVSAFGYSADCDWLFVTTETTGNSSVPVGDYFWQNYTSSDDGGWKTVRLGSDWRHGPSAGGFYWYVSDWSGARGRYSSGRLVYLGG